ncbi:MAG: D-serine ammonia-lyase [Deltaproteobacteria bacterium]|jgi:D-serine dehydratase|nr:D-serine ammonia-lyase [Deltaproteobacteria bacterium]
MSVSEYNFREQPLFADLAAARPVFWPNSLLAPAAQAAPDGGFSRADMDDAAARLQRFAPYIAKVFPETAPSQGLLESPLHAAESLAPALNKKHPFSGRLFIKLDSHLPVSGSIKSRGGIHEVLKYAEDLALAAGLLKPDDDYARLAEPEFVQFFSRYSVAVGSTGNLGLSIGIMSARLGFSVTVHMSADARQWKKDLLRAKGAKVVEYADDYSAAVAEGRRQALATPGCHFVDDENSRDLFLGYSVAAQRLKPQLEALGLAPSLEKPVSVYLPCGVGGAPGGVAWGLKLLFGDAVRCWFAEPVQAPCVLLGLFSRLGDKISVQDIGLTGVTAADGLAVARASGPACKAMRRLLDGAFTIEDDELYRLLALTADTEKLQLEPSALAGFTGPSLVTAYEKEQGLAPSAAHILWATGGSMTPRAEWQSYYEKGKSLG